MKKRFVAVSIAGIIALTYLITYILPLAEQLIAQPGPLAYTVYVLLIITEVVVAPIPGGILALLGAANFGFYPAWGLNYLANVIGAQIAFLLARAFGKPFVDRIVKQSVQKRYDAFVTGNAGYAYFAYAFPFFPIDALSFLFGLSSINHKKFFTVTSLGLISNSAAYAYLGSRFGTRVPYLQEISVIVFVSIIGAVSMWLYLNRDLFKRGFK